MRIEDKIEKYLNEAGRIPGKEKKKIKLEKINFDTGKVYKTKITVGIGELVDIKDGTKPVLGKNKYNVVAGKISRIKGNYIKLFAEEEGEFWYKASDLYYGV